MKAQTLVNIILDRLPASNSAVTFTSIDNKGVVRPKLNNMLIESE